MQIIPLRHQIHRPHQRPVPAADRLLQIQRQRQIRAPIRVLKPALVGARQQHYLARAHAALLRHRLVHHAVGAERVAVHVYHYPDARVIRQILLHRRARPAVAAGVARIVVYPAVVDDVQPRLGQKRGQLVADAYYIIFRVLGAAGVARLIAVKPRRSVGLAAVGVDYEYLRLVRAEPDVRSLREHRRDVDRVRGLVADAQPAAYRGGQDVLRGGLRRFRTRFRRRLGAGACLRRDELRLYRGRTRRHVRHDGHVLHALRAYPAQHSAAHPRGQSAGRRKIYAQRCDPRRSKLSGRFHSLRRLLSIIIYAAKRRDISPLKSN